MVNIFDKYDETINSFGISKYVDKNVINAPF